MASTKEHSRWQMWLFLKKQAAGVAHNNSDKPQ